MIVSKVHNLQVVNGSPDDILAAPGCYAWTSKEGCRLHEFHIDGRCPTLRVRHILAQPWMTGAPLVSIAGIHGNSVVVTYLLRMFGDVGWFKMLY